METTLRIMLKIDIGVVVLSIVFCKICKFMARLLTMCTKVNKALNTNEVENYNTNTKFTEFFM